MNSIRFDNVDLDAMVRLNRLRAAGPTPELLELEERFVLDFASDSQLAVYGTLAPGKPNHHHLSSLKGKWTGGCAVMGTLEPLGWGADLGYPALRWSESGDAIPVQLFASPDLPKHWARLDEFEGGDYLRILVPVHAAGEVVAVANIYAARSARVG